MIPTQMLAAAALKFNLDGRSYLVDQMGLEPEGRSFSIHLQELTREMNDQKRRFEESFRSAVLEHGLVSNAVASGMEAETYLTCFGQINTSTPEWQRKILVRVFGELLANATHAGRQHDVMDVQRVGAELFA